MIGITSCGAYIPRLRLARRTIAQAHQWSQPGVSKMAKGERAICNWDEDTLTMAVEAARDCLHDGRRISALYLGSTTLPFQDRHNATVVAAALDLPEALDVLDISGSQRAGTSALAAALRAGRSESAEGETLVVASEHRRTKSGSPHEMRFGDAAAAFTVSRDRPVAELLAIESLSIDFVDHYRGQTEAFDYHWEERWVRDEGFMKIVPRAISAALESAGLGADAIDHLVLPTSLPGVADKLRERLGFRDDSLADSLLGSVGEAGSAHPLLVLASVLERATPGQTILVASFGQGCDAIILRTTDALSNMARQRGVSGWLARRSEETDYGRFLSFNGLVDRELGMRAEVDHQTALTQLYRRRDMLFGLVGGECRKCGTRQFPRSRVCVNPNCTEMNSQEPYRFADLPARIVTWSADHLTFTPDPPAHYGLIQFDGGGRIFANFTDVKAGTVDVGQKMLMMFRVKEYDENRGFPRYFWKAVPAADPASTKQTEMGA